MSQGDLGLHHYSASGEIHELGQLTQLELTESQLCSFVEWGIFLAQGDERERGRVIWGGSVWVSVVQERVSGQWLGRVEGALEYRAQGH